MVNAYQVMRIDHILQRQYVYFRTSKIGKAKMPDAQTQCNPGDRVVLLFCF